MSSKSDPSKMTSSAAAPGTDPLALAIYQRDRWIESYNREHLRRVELEGEVEWLRARIEALEQGEGNHGSHT